MKVAEKKGESVRGRWQKVERDTTARPARSARKSYLSFWIRQRLHFKIKEKTNLKGKLIIKGKSAIYL
jgi:hypothetical protein